MAGHAFVEHLLACSGISLGEIGIDRLLGRRTARAFLLDAGDRIAHLFRALAQEHLAGDDRGSQCDDPREQHPAGDGVEAIVHEVSLIVLIGAMNGIAPPFTGDLDLLQAAARGRSVALSASSAARR